HKNGRNEKSKEHSCRNREANIQGTKSAKVMCSSWFGVHSIIRRHDIIWRMPMKSVAAATLVLIAATPAFAHVTVAPQLAPVNASQVYKVRVHNDGKTPTSSIQVQVPEEITIDSVAPVEGAKSELLKTGSRVSAITW